MEWNNAKDGIVKLLSKQERMTISDIADSLKLHRHTASRYVLALQAAGYIECHEDGRAKVCVLKRGVRK